MAKVRLPRTDVRWLVLAGVAVPLAMMLGLQYWALSRLESTSPAAARIELSARARELAEDVQQALESDARARLDVPAGSYHPEFCGDDLAALFKGRPRHGVQTYFVGSPSPDGKARVMLYDPERREVVEHRSATSLAAMAAFLPYYRHIVRQEVVDPEALSVTESDPLNRVILKPIVDTDGRIVAASGMVLDSCYYSGEFLPRTMPDVVEKYFGTSESCNIAITVRDESGQAVFTSDGRASGTDEVRERLPFVFTNWTLGVRFKDGSYAQWARKLFLLNMTLSLLMTAAVLVAVGLAFRLAAREVKLSKMKSDFVSNVSHELRTPLASIRVLAEFLKLGWYRTDDTVQEYGKYIEAESTRLTRLIDNILDFSKIESGQRVYRFELADVEDLVAATVATFEPRARSLGFTVELEPPSEDLPPVSVDPDQFSHALLNLLDNAVKYSGDSKAVRVSVGREGDRIAVAVQDFGLGIARSEQSKIFERFYRVTDGLVHDVKGSGLGLSIVKHIVDAHGATVRVESEPGTGSTFSILLPVAASEAPVLQTAAAGLA